MNASPTAARSVSGPILRPPRTHRLTADDNEITTTADGIPANRRRVARKPLLGRDQGDRFLFGELSCSRSPVATTAMASWRPSLPPLKLQRRSNRTCGRGDAGCTAAVAGAFVIINTHSGQRRSWRRCIPSHRDASSASRDLSTAPSLVIDIHTHTHTHTHELRHCMALRRNNSWRLWMM